MQRGLMMKFKRIVIILISIFFILLSITITHRPYLLKIWSFVDDFNYTQRDAVLVSDLPYFKKYKTDKEISSVDTVFIDGNSYILSTSMLTSRVFITDIASAETIAIKNPLISKPRLAKWCDINGDGFPEAVIPNWSISSSEIVVLYFNDLTFNIKTSKVFQSGYRPRSLLCNDLDNNGYNDIVVVNNFSDSISIFLNNKGKLMRRSELSVGQEPGAAFIADINNDSRLDILVSNRGSNDLNIFIQDLDFNYKYSQESRLPLVATPKDIGVITLDNNKNGAHVFSVNGDSFTLQLLELNKNQHLLKTSHVLLSGTPHALKLRQGLDKNNVRLYIATYPNWLEVVDFCGSSFKYQASFWLGKYSKEKILYLDLIDPKSDRLILAVAGNSFIAEVQPDLPDICHFE